MRRHADAACMVLSALLVAVANVPLAAGDVTPAQKCESRKNQLAGKYAECRHKAEGKLALGGDVATYDAGVARCLESFADKWAKPASGVELSRFAAAGPSNPAAD